MTRWSYCNLCRYAHFETRATVVNLCNYVAWWSVKLKSYHWFLLFNLNHILKIKSVSAKLFALLSFLPHKRCFLTETWIRTIMDTGNERRSCLATHTYWTASINVKFAYCFSAFSKYRLLFCACVWLGRTCFFLVFVTEECEPPIHLDNKCIKFICMRE